MKILKLSPYCYPERVSSTHLSGDLNKSLYAKGHVIEVFAPVPSRGISKEVRREYKKKKYEELHDGKFIIHRFSMIPEGKNPIQRAIKYVATNVAQYFKGSKAKDVDLIYSASTPPTQGVLCGKVKKKLSKRYGHPVPYLYCLHDVFPDSLVHSKMTKRGSLIWKIGRKIEDYTYKSADKIIVISNDIKKNIMEKGVPEEKIAVIPNWIDTDAVQFIPRDKNTLFDELGLDRDKFYVTYAGNLGKAQSVDTILDAAEILKDQNDIQFVIFGAGAEKDALSQRIEEMPNVRLFPLQPPERIPEVYSLGDLSIVACKKGIGGGAIPSKTFSIMATATPVLLSFDKGSELWRLVEKNDCGFLSDSEQPEELAECILEAKEHPDLVKVKGNNALELVRRDYSKERGTAAYLAVMAELVPADKKKSI